MLNNLRLGTRLGFGFGSIVLIFAVVSTVVFILLDSVKEHTSSIRDINIPKTAQASQMLHSMYMMRLSMRDVIFHSGDRAARDGESIEKHRVELLGHMEDFNKILKIRSQEKEEEIMKQLREDLAKAVPMQKQLIEHGIAGNTEAASDTLDILSKILGSSIARLDELMVFESGLNVERADGIAAESGKASTTIIVCTLIAVVLALMAGFFVTRSITQPVGRMLETVEAMADGDLSRTIVAESKDEIGTLQSALGRMNTSLAKMIGEVRNSAGELVTSATDLSGAAGDVRKGSELQSDAASAMAAALEQMSTSISHVSTLSEDARQTSAEAGKTAYAGSSTIHSMVDEIRQIAEAIREGATKAQQLGKESERISMIIHVIRDVADQTNLLALNAAIEAARAGEQGRGFAVVADEVRKLAEKTTASAQEITEMVGSIQTGSNLMTTQMETTAKRMHEGTELGQKAEGAIGEINTGTQTVVKMIDEVSVALKEQATASHDIASRVEQIVQMVEENSSAVSSVADSAEHLNALAETLNGVVERFKVS